MEEKKYTGSSCKEYVIDLVGGYLELLRQNYGNDSEYDEIEEALKAYSSVTFHDRKLTDIEDISVIQYRSADYLTFGFKDNVKDGRFPYMVKLGAGWNMAWFVGLGKDSSYKTGMEGVRTRVTKLVVDLYKGFSPGTWLKYGGR